MQRRFDDLGRIHIPKEMRDSLGINYGDICEVFVENDHIVLKPFKKDTEVTR